MNWMKWWRVYDDAEFRRLDYGCLIRRELVGTAQPEIIFGLLSAWRAMDDHIVAERNAP